MAEIPEIGVRGIVIPEIPAWRAMPPQSVPAAPPITLQIGFPVAHIPGCVETRNSAAGDKDIYNTDPKGNITVCSGEMPSYKPINYTPGTLTYSTAKTPTPPEEQEAEQEKKSAGDSNQPTTPLPPGSGIPDNLLDSQELPCPPPDAIPIGAKNKSQTAVVIGYRRIDGKCETIEEPLPVPAIVGNYLPGAPVVITTAAIAATATTSAIVAKPLGDYVLKLVKPTVKKTIKKIKSRLGQQTGVESVFERRQNQRLLRR